MDAPKQSPMLDQYRRIKKEHEGNILFFRLGDFYEMFAEDAVEVSALLNLTLTARAGVPMCGVPYHAAKTYIARLLKLGKKIAVCEQLSPAGKSKVMQREVTEIITPGTTVDEDFLDKSSSNYLSCLASAANAPLPGKVLSFSYIDLSTGEFLATAFKNDEIEMLRQELERLSVKEMLIQESLLEENKALAAAIYERSGLVLNRWADWLFDPSQAKERLQKQFGLANLKGLGLDDASGEIVSAGALLDYLDATSKSILPHIKTLKVYSENEYLGIDQSSIRNLELLKNLHDQDKRFSLFEVMDETKTAMGRRLLKKRILYPLRNLEKINARLDMAETLYRDQKKLSILRDHLGKAPDLERLCSRLAMDKAHGRDMLSIKNALSVFIFVFTLVDDKMRFEEKPVFNKDDLEKAIELLEKGISSEPSVVLNEGGLIKKGYSAQLDELVNLKDNARGYLEEYLEEEREKTKIANLKIRYNRMIGYYFEVTKAQLSRVPSYFIRRQNITGGERYSTEKLASLESEINGASEKVIELEKKLFLEIRSLLKDKIFQIMNAANLLAELDAAQSIAKASSVRGWTRPQLDESAILKIIEARHPVVEAHLSRGHFMPNDIILNDEKSKISFAMITGPNMAGKSTYLRSAALITVMAQAGSFVPATQAYLGLCDRVYCRVGASDNLARGESTFLVEMNETAFIMNTATEKSLVIMDEVGRGTGTNDGLSIAWAVSEELLNRIGCRTLFATHFHELSLLSHPRLANRSMEVLDKNGKIVFLRKLKEGPAAESYGIHVADLAGISESILQRAVQIMKLLKKRDCDLSEIFTEEGFSVNLEEKSVNEKESLQENSAACIIEKALLETDIEQITPLEALNLLCQWKKLASSRGNAPSANEKKKIKNSNKDDSPPLLFEF